jgi:hypothetical protein
MVIFPHRVLAGLGVCPAKTKDPPGTGGLRDEGVSSR